MPNLTVVAIEIPERTEHFYKKWRVPKKINLLKRKINLAYDLAKQKHPENPVIVAWREHGVFDMSEPFFVTREEGQKREAIATLCQYEHKAPFKRMLRSLTKDRDDLMIIAGTIATIDKRFATADAGEKKKAKMTKMKAEYEKFSYIEDPDFKELAARFNKNCDKPVIIIENTCYIASKGQLYKIGKAIPATNEIPDDVDTPGEEKHYLYSFQKKGAVIEFKGVNIGIEICMEHGFGLLSKANSEAQMKLPLHLILSNYCSLYRQNFEGDRIVHIDSTYVFKGHKVTTKNPDPGIKIYRLSAFTKTPSLIEGVVKFVDPKLVVAEESDEEMRHDDDAYEESEDEISSVDESSNDESLDEEEFSSELSDDDAILSQNKRIKTGHFGFGLFTGNPSQVNLEDIDAGPWDQFKQEQIEDFETFLNSTSPGNK